DARTGQPGPVINAEPGSFGPVFSADGSRVATTRIGEVVLHDGRTGKEYVRFACPARPNAMEFTSDGSRLVVGVWLGQGKGAVLEHDVRTGRQLAVIPFPGDFPHITFAPDGARLLIANSSVSPIAGVVRMWDRRTAKEVFTLRLPAHPTKAVFSPDGTRIA